MAYINNINFIDIEGVRTRYYDDKGNGDPIVLIHGAHFGFAIPIGIEQWALNLEALAASGRVIAFDKLGQGYTDAPERDEHWTFDALAAHAIAFLEALELRSINLVGHSRGGLLALHIAIKRPDLIKRLIVVSTASAAPETSTPIVNEAAAMTVGQYTPEELVGFLRLAQATDRALPESFTKFVLDVAKLPKLAAEGACLKRVEEKYWAPTLSRARADVLAHLAAEGLPMPTLVIWGMNDRSAPIAMGNALFEVVAKTTTKSMMVTLNQAGHNIFIDQSDSFNSIIKIFLET